MKIIQQPYSEEVVTYQRVYGSKEGEMYFGFDCDPKGNIDEEKLHPAALENYKSCEAGTKEVNGVKMHFIEVKKYERTLRHDRIGLCDVCEEKIWLSDPLTNTCNCGAEYNMSGQRLRPREEWEENYDED